MMRWVVVCIALLGACDGGDWYASYSYLGSDHWVTLGGPYPTEAVCFAEGWRLLRDASFDLDRVELACAD